VLVTVQGLEGGLLVTTDGEGRAKVPLTQGEDSFLVLARFPGNESLAASVQSVRVEPQAPLAASTGAWGALAWVLPAAALLLSIASLLAYRASRRPLDAVLRRARKAFIIGGGPKRQILMAYRVLETAAIARGRLSRPAVTPRGLEASLRGVLPAAVHAPLGRLIAVFEVARYGHRPPTESERDVALAALDTIIAAHEASVADPFVGYQVHGVEG
jgi:hypothetical protein